MNEGEKKKSKKVYKRGDRITFRLPIKDKYSDDVIMLLNQANQADELNHELIRALELYTKYKTFNEANMSDVEKKFIIQEKVIGNPEAKERSQYEPIREAEGMEEILNDIYEDQESSLTRRTFNISRRDEETNNNKVIEVNTWQSYIKSDEAEDEIFASSKEENTNIKQEKGTMENAFRSIRRTR